MMYYRQQELENMSVWAFAQRLWMFGALVGVSTFLYQSHVFTYRTQNEIHHHLRAAMLDPPRTILSSTPAVESPSAVDPLLMVGAISSDSNIDSTNVADEIMAHHDSMDDDNNNNNHVESKENILIEEANAFERQQP